MNNLVIQNNDMQILQAIATTAYKSGLYNQVGGMEKIMMVLLAAHDLGIKPTIALNGGVWNIKGKIEISARLMTSMIRRAGHNLTVVESNENICTLKAKRADTADEMSLSFTIEMAKKANLLNSDAWKKYPEDMLYARALSRLGRRLFADVIGEAYVQGEIKDSDMQQEECEVSNVETQKEHIEPPKLELTMIETEELTQEQAQEIDYLYAKCDPDYLKKLLGYLPSIGVPTLADLKQDNFVKIVKGMRANAELYAKQRK